MAEPHQRDFAAATIPYASAGSKVDLRRQAHRAQLLAGASVTLALLGFPIGAGTSFVTGLYPELFSRAVSERAGFMLFAVLEGLAAACGLLAALWARQIHRRAYRVAVAGTVLGAAGSGIVLLLIAAKAIR
jgi:hypothetical protein